MSYEYCVDLQSICRAYERIKGISTRTPVMTSTSIEKMLERPCRVYFKCESFQRVGAFKYRGALNAVLRRLEKMGNETDTITFVTHSSGNHAQALALAARDCHQKAVVIMPSNAPKAKKRAVASYRAEIVLCEPTVQAREETAARYVAARNGCFVHPSNDPDVIDGQGTTAVEFLNQVEEEYDTPLDILIVPVGGGGLAAGVAIAAKALYPNIKVYAAEPECASDAFQSMQSGQLITRHIREPKTIADGLRTTLGDQNWPIIRDFVDGIILVSESEIIQAMRLIWERMKVIVEPSGAVAAAALFAKKVPFSNGDIPHVGIILSGGNVDLDHLPWTASL